MRLIGERSRAAPVVEWDIESWHGLERETRQDGLAVEEPLEIRLAGYSVAVTMRTPGDDFELSAGFLFTEGIIRGTRDIASIAFCPQDHNQVADNIVNVNPADPALVDPGRWRRNFFATSSCGICGKANIDAVCQDVPRLSSRIRVQAEILYRLSGELTRAQEVFSRTGGLHAAGLFDAEGRLLLLREDVGRHNAVDKIIGAAVLGAIHDCEGAVLEPPLTNSVLLVSGRASFEITQKALMAGIPILAAVSAPSSLAVDLARSAGMTLAGFLRSGRFNVYSGEERIVR